MKIDEIDAPACNFAPRARGEAVRRWPGMAAHFARVRDDGRAEACLIGVAGILRGVR